MDQLINQCTALNGVDEMTEEMEQVYSCQVLLLKGHYSGGFIYMCCWINFDLTKKAIYLVFVWLILDFLK